MAAREDVAGLSQSVKLVLVLVCLLAVIVGLVLWIFLSPSLSEAAARIDRSGMPAAGVEETAVEETEDWEKHKPLRVVFSSYVIMNAPGEFQVPNQIQVVVQSGSRQHQITWATVAFAAWDKAGQPVLLPDAAGQAYLVEHTYDNIMLAYEDTYGIDHGYEVDPNLEIAWVQATVVSLETADGRIWQNPEYGVFRQRYEGQPFMEAADEYIPDGGVTLLDGGIYRWVDIEGGTAEGKDTIFTEVEAIDAVVFLDAPYQRVVFDWQFPDGTQRPDDRREDFNGRQMLFSGMALANRGYGTGSVTVTLEATGEVLAVYQFEIEDPANYPR